MSQARVNPLAPPYSESITAVLARFPQGPDGPIGLFRTLAHSERALRKVGQAGLLDKDSPIEMLDREIVILRTSARCHCSYEWGVHVAAFSAHVGLTAEQVEATAHGEASDPVWSAQQQVLLHCVDELVATSDLSEPVWQQLRKFYNLDQVFELLLLVGSYHSVAFLNNVLRVEQEPFAPQF